MADFIIDAGPFIHLQEIGLLKLLTKLPTIIIPASVAKEISIDQSCSDLITIKSWPNLKIIPKSDQPAMNVRLKTLIARSTLHTGEIDCLNLALQNPEDQAHSCVFLTDDMAARIAAMKLGIEVHGTVGVIAYSVKRKWLSLQKAEKALESLQQKSSLFIAGAIIQRAIVSLRKLHRPSA